MDVATRDIAATMAYLKLRYDRIAIPKRFGKKPNRRVGIRIDDRVVSDGVPWCVSVVCQVG